MKKMTLLLLIALRDVGSTAAPLVRDLIDLLDDKNIYVDREEAVRTLRKIGTPAALDAAKRLGHAP